MLPWYIIEVTLEKQSHTEFRAEDGIVYERMHGTTVQRSGQAGLERTRCDRCGELGHMARACPRPPTCFRCGETGHQAFRCPRGAGHKVVTTPTSHHHSSYNHYNFRIHSETRGMSRKLTIVSNFVTYVRAMVME